jgi:hypothetical protein
VDGHEGSFLRKLAEQSDLPKGFFPVGLSFSAETPLLREGHQISILAIDEDAMNSAGGSVAAYLKHEGHVHVQKFPINLKTAEVLRLIKRMNIILTDKVVPGAHVKVVTSPKEP